MEEDKSLKLILAEIKKFRSDNKAEFEKVRLETKADFEKVRLETKADFEKVRSETKSDLTIIATKIELINTAIKDTSVKMDKICKKVNSHEGRIEKLEELSKVTESFNLEYDIFTNEVTTNLAAKDKEIAGLKSQLDSIEIDRRRNNLVINGLPESQGEDKAKLAFNVRNIFKDLLGIEGNIQPYQVYRRGENRRIILRLEDPNTKSLILKNAYKLKGSKIYISHDFTIKQEAARYYLRQFIKTKGNGKAKFSSQFTIEMEGITYHYNELKKRVEVKN